jgi:Flp pilus assembly protein TadD
MPTDAPRAALLRRLSTQLEAMLAHADGNTEQAITALRELAAAEPNNASLPPTIIPSYELLGDYLLAARRHAEAADAYGKALELRANRAAALRGLERARRP